MKKAVKFAPLLLILPFLNRSDYKKNIFISSDSSFSKESNVLVSHKGQSYLGHPLNVENKTEKEKIVIIGGGIIGLTTSYYLCQTGKYDVTLLEKNDDISLESSFKNGCNFCPSLYEPWINENIPTYLFKSLINKNYPIKLHFNLFKDSDIFIYFSNVLVAIYTNKVPQNRLKLFNLGNLSNKELKKLYDEKIITPIDIESITKGNLALYSCDIKYDHFQSKLDKGLEGKQIKESDFYQEEPNLIKQNAKNGVVIYGDTSMNIYEFDKKLAEFLKNKYQDSFRILTSTPFTNFILSPSSQILGVNTPQGFILADKFIVSAGNHSPSILGFLKINLPVIPVQGHSLTVPVPKNKTPLNFNITDDVSKIYLTQIGGLLSINKNEMNELSPKNANKLNENNNELTLNSNVSKVNEINNFNQSNENNNVIEGNKSNFGRYRLSGAADFCGFDCQIRSNRINELRRFLIQKIGEVDTAEEEQWSCLRPVSADDVPIISGVKGYENLFINAGHGSKGLTLALGSAVLMRGIIMGREEEIRKEDYDLDRFSMVYNYF